MNTMRLEKSICLLFLTACARNEPAPNHGGDNVVCPNGTPNAGMTIRTVNCSTVVQYDGDQIESSVNIPGLASAGLKNVDKVLRAVDDAATDAQVQFSQTCELYNGCNLTSAEYRQRLDTAQAHFRGIRERVAVLQASQGNPEVLRNTVHDLYRTTVPQAVRDRETLDVELVVQAKAADGGGPRVLKGGETLKTGDKLAFGVRVSQPAHVYVFQRKPSGTLDVLFPNAAISSLANPIPPTELVRIPPQGAVFTLDDQDIGEERVYLAISKEPLADLAAALTNADGKKPQATEQVTKAMTDLFGAAAPECREKTRGLQISKEDPCTELSRGLKPTPADDADFFKDESSVKATTAPGDDVILRSFSFVHAR